MFFYDTNTCTLSEVDLSNIFREEKFEVSGPTKEINETTDIRFSDSPHVDFIPPAFVDKFPNLVRIQIRESNVPIINNDLFSSKFGKIKLLYIIQSDTEFIEEKAFQHLKNLEEFALLDNPIKSLTSTIFSNNPKLKIVHLRRNQIIAVHPKLFENLHQLSIVNLYENKCEFVYEYWTDVIDHEELNRGLSACYFSCFVDNECAKDLNASVEFKCEFSEGLFEISKDLSLKMQQCKITELKFETKSTETSEIFSGSKNEKQNVTMLNINRKISIFKIPREIFEEFPSLRQLKISNMYVLVLQDNLFSTEFEKIEYLDLSHNKIQEIEENALDNLVNLKWLHLESNRLSALNTYEFRNNKKLEYINLYKNWIKKINQRAFISLKNLKFVQLENNRCVKRSIGCSNCTISEEDLENALGECYRRYYQIDIVQEGVGDINYVDFSVNSQRHKFTFDGSKEEKEKVTKFSFSAISKIDYMPSVIFTEFSNLNEIKIYASKIPVLKENLFGEECEKIETLWLWNNGIKIIEKKAFYHLKNLVEIKLSENKIESYKCGKIWQVSQKD